MKCFQRTPVSMVLLLALAVPGAAAAQSRVADTLHNLSVSGPGEVHALSETEVCKFCHIPHKAVVPHPLWGHELSSARYRVPDITSPSGATEPAPQPNGASRLCLSCHDGTVALGDIGSGRPISMSGPQRLLPGRPGHLGTDLSGSHPISFVVPDAAGATNPDDNRDMGLRPLASITTDPDVHLDARGRMQCTTCHDPHADRFFERGKVPHFWVKPTVQEVCVTCHALR